VTLRNGPHRENPPNGESLRQRASCLSAAIYGSGVGDIAGHNPLLRVAQIHPWREWNGVLYPFPRA
jgi:hypothetical protein